VPQRYVLGPRDGEHLVLRGGDMFIKVHPITGSNGLGHGIATDLDRRGDSNSQTLANG
jgi:hypothetical protein